VKYIRKQNKLRNADHRVQSFRDSPKYMYVAHYAVLFVIR